MAFEEEFDIEIPDKVADNIRTPNEAIDYIYQQLKPEEEGDDHDH